MYMWVLKLAIPDLFPVFDGALLVLQRWVSFSCLALFVLKIQTRDVANAISTMCILKW